MYNKSMRKYRTMLGNRLFKLARKMYESDNPMRKAMGNRLFKMAAKVSPNKEQ